MSNSPSIETAASMESEAIPVSAIGLIRQLLHPEELSTIQYEILAKCWNGATYQNVADATAYDTTYIRAVGAQLWQKLSTALGQRITKSNFQFVIQQRCMVEESLTTPETWVSPRGQVPLDSPIYIERPPTEQTCYNAVQQPGSLIRIKAPKQMGKTSLMSRIVDRARRSNYATVTLNLSLASTEILADADRFFQWFCLLVSKLLQLPNRLDDYWQTVFGSRYNCTEYFGKYLLPELNRPFVLALDNVDILFNYPDIANDFFGMLRAWYENARYGNEESAIWQELRLLVIYSTEIYLPLSIHQSPFNVGLPVELRPLNAEQVGSLAERYQLHWCDDEVESLMSLIGGHPYLVRLALHHAAQTSSDVESVLESAIAPTGIYTDYLQSRFWALQRHPTLLAAMKRLVTETSPLAIDPVTELKLEGMGFVRLDSNTVHPACLLYKKYFKGMFETIEPE